MRKWLAQFRGHLKEHPWLVSMIFHTTVLLVMGLWVFADSIGDNVQTITASFQTGTDAEASFSLMPALSIDSPSTDAADWLDEMVETQPAAAAIAIGDFPSTSEPISDIGLEWLQPDPSASFASLRLDSGSAKGEDTGERAVSTAEQIASAGGIESATASVENAIRGELKQGDTLVVWLLDASISLQLNRDRMANRIRAFYEDIGVLSRPATSDGIERHQLFSSVVAFGQSVQEVSRPSPIGAKAIESMTKVPIDKSGVEHTLSAVEAVVDLYRTRQRRKERLLVVVLTDESGDDGLKLEYTITKCRNANAVVHVLGPTAVMGAQEGSQLWSTEMNGRQYDFLLTVNRGPETCLPERLFLPYWHEATLPAWKPKVRPAVAMPWYGGDYREGVLSGFGPYTLTRLALQTGGTFTLYDDGVGDRYDLKKLRDYMPDYGSLTTYRAAIQDNPIRQFVTRSAEQTLREKDLFASPRMIFMGERSPRYPFFPITMYYSPAEFRTRFSNAIRQERKRCEDALHELESLMPDEPSEGWPAALDQEPAQRWRASFVLSYGRSLAVAARYHEYLAACDEAQQSLGSETNAIDFTPGGKFRTSPGAALAGQARNWLEQCVVDHRDTPWADLAAWELEKPFGINIRARSVPRPKPRVGVARPMRPMASGGGQSFSFPSL